MNPIPTTDARRRTKRVGEVDWTALPGRLVVLSGASGSGKSTLVQRLLEKAGPGVRRSVSATTRPPRPGETHGEDYVFVAPDEFERLRADLLESARVHGFWYGTPAEPVRQALAKGICVVLVIDVQGGLQVREKVPNALLIFIQAPSADVLEHRLRARGTDDEATIARRLNNARLEIETARGYEIHLVNDDLETCVDELAATLKTHHCGG